MTFVATLQIYGIASRNFILVSLWTTSFVLLVAIALILLTAMQTVDCLHTFCIRNMNQFVIIDIVEMASLS